MGHPVCAVHVLASCTVVGVVATLHALTVACLTILTPYAGGAAAAAANATGGASAAAAPGGATHTFTEKTTDVSTAGGNAAAGSSAGGDAQVRLCIWPSALREPQVLVLTSLDAQGQLQPLVIGIEP